MPRCAAQADFEARRLQVRCGAKQLCSRGKRYVHVLQATACRPTACLLALAAAAPEALPSGRKPSIAAEALPRRQRPHKLCMFDL